MLIQYAIMITANIVFFCTSYKNFKNDFTNYFNILIYIFLIEMILK